MEEAGLKAAERVRALDKELKLTTANFKVAGKKLEKLNQLDMKGTKIDEDRKMLDEAIRAYQEGRLKRTKTGKWVPRDDKDYSEDLKTLRYWIEGWARLHVLKSSLAWQDLCQSMPTDLLAALSNVALLPHGTIPAVLHDIPGPEILLGALLAHQLCTKIIAEPFIAMN